MSFCRDAGGSCHIRYGARPRRHAKGVIDPPLDGSFRPKHMTKTHRYLTFYRLFGTPKHSFLSPNMRIWNHLSDQRSDVRIGYVDLSKTKNLWEGIMMNLPNANERSRLSRRTLLGLLASVLVSSTVRAESYPARSVRVIVPFPPGGATDLIG